MLPHKLYPAADASVAPLDSAAKLMAAETIELWFTASTMAAKDRITLKLLR
jgi:hypothetical protein